MNATYKLIANALEKFLSVQIQSDQSSRRFFRLDGFDEKTYEELLASLIAQNFSLAGQNLWGRTTAPIEGYDDYTLEEGKSATWYRNNVPQGHALILIFNHLTSDAQSLKDIYPVTETLLVVEGLDQLIDAAFQSYQLISEQRDVLKRFVQQLHDKLFRPQLRDIADFLAALNEYLHMTPGASIEKAIAHSLPHLNLFSCIELAGILNTSKGLRLLRHNYKVSRLGLELLDESDQRKYLKLLKEAEFDDDSEFGGLSSEEKRSKLYSFLVDVLIDKNQLMDVLQIDWDEVSPILYKPARKTKEEYAREIASNLQKTLEEQQIELSELPEDTQHAIEDLEAGNEPDEEGLDSILDELGDGLPRTLKNQIKRLRGVKKYRTSDFIVGVTRTAIEILSALQDGEENLTLSISFDAQQINQGGSLTNKDLEALLAFRTLYGGIEDIMKLENQIVWSITPLWDLLADHRDLSEFLVGEEDQDQRNEKVELVFTIKVLGRDGSSHDAADLIWLYQQDSPAAATLAHLSTEAQKIKENASPQLAIPIYNNAPITDEIGDIDLGRPIRSLGAWFRESNNLAEMLAKELKSRTSDENWNKISVSLSQLEEAWTKFVRASSQNGTLAADLNALLLGYENFLATAACVFQTGQDVYGFRPITQAWIIGPPSFNEWAVVPFLHPLKLHWWYERAREFTQFITNLLEQKVFIVDERRFRRELDATYGSSNYPALITLPRRDMRPEYFLPVQEVEGYELYLPIGQASVAYGLDPTLVTETESDRAATIAGRELARVIQDYIETYPFVRDGLEIYLIQCRNGALPGLLVEELERIAQRRNWKLQLNVIVHTVDRGAPLYQRVTEWLKSNEAFSERNDGYIPLVTLKVLECPRKELYSILEDTDLVILPDVLAEHGQQIEFIEEDKVSNTPPLDGYLPLYRAQQVPFEKTETTRDILITTLYQPVLLQHFYNVQWAAKERKVIPAGKNFAYHLRVSLHDWEPDLEKLHQYFNWVVCYDTTIDRFLLEATFPGTVEVIRYSLGLGVNQRHNLTVSSSSQAQNIVIRRLASNLEHLLRQANDDFRHQIARRLVEEAKSISGDIVLRAAGPGVYLNELIGMIVAKHRTEKRYFEQHPNALTTWIYLDDFSHWFDRKFPDLLFVAMTFEPKGLSLHIEVIEAKCISETNFTSEAMDAQRQVAQGVNRLAQAWRPGGRHLDATYWYDQLYRAIVGNLTVERDQRHLWQHFSRCFPNGDFLLEMSGHSWVCCYDGTSGVTGFLDEGDSQILASEATEISHCYHHVGRTGLRQYLRELVEDWGVEAPEEIWILDDTELPASPELVQANEDAMETSFDELIEEPQSADVLIENRPEQKDLEGWLKDKAQELTRTLRDYDIRVRPIELDKIDVGPSIARFKLRLYPGEKINRIQSIAVDLARELALHNTPLIENVSGTQFVGVDIPRQEPEAVPQLDYLVKLQDLNNFQVPFLVGMTPDGQIQTEYLAELRHLLVAGSTGSGKTIFLYSLLVSLLSQFSQKELQLLLIDPKQTDFVYFEGIPHLLGNSVIIEPEEAIGWLEHLTEEVLTERTEQLRDARSRDLQDYNLKNPQEPMPPIVVIIDEYADLVQVLGNGGRQEFEHNMIRLAQRARNVGIHLVIATQRPSADIVTSKLKTNLPARIAFRLPSHHDSMTILDQSGAENLLGRGDLLFKKSTGITRLQGFYLSTEELDRFLEKRGLI
ncbi:MAG: DNA translocase FtsK [Candidatus Babeliaceae bacterium]|nr:DNA translocase FtsK [Candidatus Babeliaceae bacterium]